MKLEWLNNLITGMNPGQRFIGYVITVILGLGGFYFVQYSSAATKSANELLVIEKVDDIAKTLDDISFDLVILRNGNNNNLSLPMAKTWCARMLNAARGNIIEYVHQVISHNHINDPARQDLIRSGLTNRVTSYYTADHAAMERVYYHGQQMSFIWDMFYPEQVVDKICIMMFDPKYNNNHNLLRHDIVNLITIEFNTFNNIAIEELNKIK